MSYSCLKENGVLMVVLENVGLKKKTQSVIQTVMFILDPTKSYSALERVKMTYVLREIALPKTEKYYLNQRNFISGGASFTRNKHYYIVAMIPQKEKQANGESADQSSYSQYNIFLLEAEPNYPQFKISTFDNLKSINQKNNFLDFNESKIPPSCGFLLQLKQRNSELATVQQLKVQFDPEEQLKVT